MTPSADTSNDPIWTTYVDAATNYDETTIRSWNQSMDALLVFAALFSGVVTSFLLAVSNALAPSTANTTNEILIAILHQLSSNNTSTIPITIPDPSHQHYIPARHDILVISLMYASLGGCLIAAGGALVAKLWVIEYQNVVDKAGTNYTRALRRQAAQSGLRAWRFGTIIALLPTLLLISLLLFYFALHEFISHRQPSIGYGLSVGLSIAGTFIVVTSSFAAFLPNCPFRTPFSRGIRFCFAYILPKDTSRYAWAFACIIAISTPVVGALMGFIRDDFIVGFIIPVVAQSAMLRDVQKTSEGPMLIELPIWIALWTTIFVIIVSSTTVWGRRYILLGVSVRLGVLWAVEAFIGAVYLSGVPDTDEAEALAWLLQNRFCTKPISFETAASIAKTDHQKVILSRSLFPLLPRLTLPPMTEENAMRDLESYVICIATLGDFKLQKQSVRMNKAATTPSEMQIQQKVEELQDLIQAIDQCSQSAPCPESTPFLERGTLLSLRRKSVEAKKVLEKLVNMVPMAPQLPQSRAG